MLYDYYKLCAKFRYALESDSKTHRMRKHWRHKKFSVSVNVEQRSIVTHYAQGAANIVENIAQIEKTKLWHGIFCKFLAKDFQANPLKNLSVNSKQEKLKKILEVENLLLKRFSFFMICFLSFSVLLHRLFLNA